MVVNDYDLQTACNWIFEIIERFFGSNFMQDFQEESEAS